MKPLLTVLLTAALVLAGSTMSVAAEGENPDIIDQVLLTRSLEVAQGKDVIVDRVSLPPNTVLPRRWHPGEMFVYVMQGSVVVSPDGEEETIGRTGELVAIPLRQVYSARTTEEGAELVIFRVHDADQPVRVMVD